MHTEYEVRVLEINKEEIEKKLKKLGAKKKADYEYRRRVYNFTPKSQSKWIRLRTDGKITTLTIKKLESLEIDGTKEMEIEVSDFDETDKILNELGYKAHTYQENKRTRYILNDVEIDFDAWPYIPEYMEIEGKSIEEVENIIKVLNLDKYKITSIDVNSVFKEIYNIDIAEVPIVKFDKPLDEEYYLKK